MSPTKDYNYVPLINNTLDRMVTSKYFEAGASKGEQGPITNRSISNLQMQK